MTRRRLILLTIIATVAGVAILALVYIPRYGTALVREAASSSVGQLCLALMVGGTMVVGLLCLVLRRCTERPHPSVRSFFGNDGGTAAIETLLALPIILIIILLIVQASVLWNDNMIFHYAVYGAARSAAAVIPSYLAKSGEDHCMMNCMPMFEEYGHENSALSPDSLKYYYIRLALVGPLTSVSGRMPEGVEPTNPWMTGDQYAEIVTEALRAAGTLEDEAGWTHRIASQYRYADYYTTLVISIPDHWKYKSEPARGKHCPYQQRRREWGNMSWTWPPYCPHILNGVLDYAPWERITLGVRYYTHLSVPYAGKLLYEVISTKTENDNPGAAREEIMPGTGSTIYQLRLEKDQEFMLSG